jgi:molybdopterin synthase sulfur carrier subunit
MGVSRVPKVIVAQHLCNQFQVPSECVVEGTTLAAVVVDLDRRYPGVRKYLLDDQGALRTHVNLFIGDAWIEDRLALSDSVADGDCVTIMQALSGG